MLEIADLHTHVVFDIDDGPATFEESIRLLDMAKESCVTHIVASSHYLFSQNNDNSSYDERFDILFAEAKNRGITLYKGNELCIGTPFLDDLKSKKAYSVNGGKYILIECRIAQNVYNLENYIDVLFNNGFIPILAHPERCENILDKFDVAESLFYDGVLFQVNAGSLFGHYGFKAKQLSKRLMQNDMVFCLASDFHNPYSRPPITKKEIEKLENKWGKEKITKLLYENPIKAINNIK